ncbi:AI-2E family transporter [Candidatus Woesearchaeota archaeon]|nr:AI-2E family transporter [Candidatus Woesearchaeota archaeon]
MKTVHLSKRGAGKINQNDYRKYFFIILLLAIIYLAFLILEPFLTAILGSFVIAFIFYPVYRLTVRYVKSRNLSAFLVALFIILIVTLPTFFIANHLAGEARYFIPRVKQIVVSGKLIPAECTDDTFVCAISTEFSDLLSDEEVLYYIQESLGRVEEVILGSAAAVVFKVPKLVLDIFIMLFMVYYLLKEGPAVVERVKRLIPLDKKYQERIVTQFSEITRAVIYGWVIVAIIQGVAGALGFYFILEVPSPMLWGIVMTFAALLPFVGCTVVWLPVAMFRIAEGILIDDPQFIIRGIGMLVYGVFFIATVDNLLRPKLIGGKAKVHPVLVLLGVMGGIALFGFIGVIIGPLVLILLLTFLEIYEKQKK